MMTDERGSMRHRISAILWRVLDVVSPIFIIAGLLLAMYPTAAYIMFNIESSREISAIEATSSSYTPEQKERYLSQAAAYNAKMGKYNDGSDSALGTEALLGYEEQLDANGDGSMGWLEVPKIDLRMVVYHYTDDVVLERGVGHIEDSSLPVGGQNSLCILNGHSGMPSFRCFDSLRSCDVGDVLALHVMDEIFAYRISSWEIIEPDGFYYRIPESRDQVVLVTCSTTPDQFNPKGAIGVNDKRLIFYADRCEYDPSEFENVEVDRSVFVNEHTWQAIAVVVLVALFFLWLFLHNHFKKRRRERERQERASQRQKAH